MSVISVEVPEAVQPNLDDAAKKAGMTPSEYVQDILLENLSDQHLLRIAEERYREHLANGSKGIPLKEVMRELGLDD